MSPYRQYSTEELRAEREKLQTAYRAFQEKGLQLDMSRGKPSSEQLDLTMGMLDCVNSKDILDVDGIDPRNYGVLAGIPRVRKLFGDLLGVTLDEIIVGGNSSLNMMYDTIARACQFGVYGSKEPWNCCKERKFLCPVPGYDRHFAITEAFGFEMIPIPMTETGPDMDLVEEYVKDQTVKGIWCVPMYSNPDGITYSDETVRRFAALKPAAPDFRIIWDNAYCIHHLSDQPDKLLNIFEVCREYGSEDMVFEFASTSKITFSGSGVACMAASENNIKAVKRQMRIQTIGHDKINQLRHVRFFGDLEGIRQHMEKHRAVIAPRFKVVLDRLEQEIEPLEIAQWKKPNGGYFISLNTMDGCAKRVVRLCKEAGLVLTAAGATFPYGKDPNDRNIRIAPTYPSIEELTQAIELFCIVLRLVSVEKILEDR